MKRTPLDPPLLKGYKYERLLGSGGFSDVFLYEQELPRRKVAIKVFVEIDAAASTAFMAEANLMAQVSNHPYIATIFEAGRTDQGRPYLVMEYYPRPSLSERYRSSTFTVHDALRVAIRVCSAVATAHAAGMLHRDIKPANVLENEYGSPALADFGIASAIDDADDGSTVSSFEPAESQSVGLSIPWSPPEMFADDPRPDVRSDVFSIGATIYTILAGRTPFEVPGKSNGAADLIGRIEKGTVTPLDRAEVPKSLEAVLRKAMSPNREDRFPTAIDLARAFQRVELELGYSPTTIDVPNLEIPSRTQPDDYNTRARTLPDDAIERTRSPNVAALGADLTDPPSRRPPRLAGKSTTISLAVRPTPMAEELMDTDPNAQIFIVHGRDESRRQTIELFLRDITGVKPIVLADEPNSGRTIIEKFEAAAGRSALAIVLLTPDDVGGIAGGDSKPRARQNVIFEMGYFVGKLGRAMVITLNAGVENPSDVHGLLYIDLSTDWREALRRELRTAGIRLIN